MAALFQTMFSDPFSWMKMYEFRLIFHWSLFPRSQSTIYQHWFRRWLRTGQATSHYLNQWWLVYWRIYASLGLNELKLETTLWIMACGLNRHLKWLIDKLRSAYQIIVGDGFHFRLPWRRHAMKTFSTSLAPYEASPTCKDIEVFVLGSPNKMLNKQYCCGWFCCRSCSVTVMLLLYKTTSS